VRLGDVFEGTYRIVEELGRGSHATVYLGEHEEIGQRVAIKVMHVESPRFKREGRVLASLQSPHTVRLLAFGRTEEDEQYLISEWIDGESLLEFLKSSGPVDPAKAKNIIRQILESLAEAHENGVVHRDVKPGNVMLSDGCNVKVLDFGIAKSKDDKTLTDVGEFVGTPRYIAPEIFLGERAEPVADVFAVGMIAYALLAGEPANPHKEVDEILMRHLTDEPYELPESVAVSPALRRWVNRTIHKDPSVRPVDAGTALRDLKRTDSGRSSLEIPGPEILREEHETPIPLDDLEEDDGTIEELNIAEALGELPSLEEPTDDTEKVPDTSEQLQETTDPTELVDPTAELFDVTDSIKLAPAPARGAPPKGIIVAAVVVTVLLGVTAVLVSKGSEEPENSGPVSGAPEDPAARKLLERGKKHHQDGKLLEALRTFSELENGPASAAKAELAEQQLRERTVDQMLFEAVEATKRAETSAEFLNATQVPKEALLVFPDHPQITALIARLEASAKDIEKMKRKR
jgi:serine/threonine protein kinase